MTLDLSLIPDVFHSDAIEAFESGNAGLLSYLDNTACLSFVFDNIQPLKSRGIYEKCLLNAFTGTRTNHSAWDDAAIAFLFTRADRNKLRSAGDPLPGPGPFRVYRGVAGYGRRRRLHGFSWTSNLNRACWFATRFGLANPGILSADVTASDVLAFSASRKESEFICCPDEFARMKMTPDEIRERARRES